MEMNYQKEVAKILDEQIKEKNKELNEIDKKILKLKDEKKEVKKEIRKIEKDKNSILGIKKNKVKKDDSKKTEKVEPKITKNKNENERERILKVTEVEQMFKNAGLRFTGQIGEMRKSDVERMINQAKMNNNPL